MANVIQLDKDKFKARDDRYREAFSKGVQNANALMGGGRGGLGGLGGGNVGWKTMAGNLVGQLLMGGLLGYLLNKDGGNSSNTQGNGQPAPAPNAATGRGGTDASGLSYYPMGDEGQAAADADWARRQANRDFFNGVGAWAQYQTPEQAETQRLNSLYPREDYGTLFDTPRANYSDGFKSGLFADEDWLEKIRSVGR